MIDTFKHKGLRQRLIEELIEKGITDELVLEAMGKVPRHGFVEGAFGDEAYVDKALPIKRGQTISQPFTVAYQTQLLKLKPKMKILEIGTGSGYQAAILAMMGMKVFTIEIDRRLHLEAKERLADLELKAKFLLGDGTLGWPTFQPFERILVTAASPEVPAPLFSQLEEGGKMVIPVGDRKSQKMHVLTKISRTEFNKEIFHNFKFVPLRGKHGFIDDY